MATPLGERSGSLRYRLFDQFIRQIPVPETNSLDRKALGALAQEITELARARYALHAGVRHRLRSDLSVTLNQKLTAWWTLDFPALRAELHKAGGHDIPVAQRDEWEAWLAAQRADHARLTADIVHRETELNARVYALFGLTEDEIAIIEASTKYRYGEV